MRKLIKWMKTADGAYLAARKSGLDRRQAIGVASNRQQQQAYLQLADIPAERYGVLVDVGTNRGQFLRMALARFAPRHAVCVEPLPDAFAELQTHYGTRLDISLNQCVLGANEGMVDLEVNRHDQASSVLPIRTSGDLRFTHRDLTPEETIQVPMKTLDNLLESEGVKEIEILKIDVQGYELEVLRGATATLPHVRHILVEMNFYSQYAGTALFSDVHDYLYTHGFVLHALGDYQRMKDEVILQGDAVYIRQDRLSSTLPGEGH